ncbi:hypothetical protein ALO_13709 [Acetonema longum DSM 6540]|uniref:Integrase catalytic domain-containing protein n=1 Tax=Acetonema longum DSM 6540 TaxID=1009370 RepID=F7NKX3_9FIRM|nr:hypothetical protein ALO_13709 [Acetonema longum DSM 6540]
MAEKFQTREQARSAVFEYVEIFYNRQRIHATNGYRIPEGTSLLFTAFISLYPKIIITSLSLSYRFRQSPRARNGFIARGAARISAYMTALIKVARSIFPDRAASDTAASCGLNTGTSGAAGSGEAMGIV